VSIAAGDRAPAFTIETTEGPRSLAALLQDGPLVLVFYTEDDTPLCSAQVTTFRDEHGALHGLGAHVLAVSADTLESHHAFAERLGGLPFPLAADPDLVLARAYGVAGEDGRRVRRAVFVIAADGTVLEANSHYQPGVMDQFAAVFRALGLEL